MMKFREALLFALAGVASAACGATQKAEPLDRGVHRYNDSIRWQRLSQAAQYIPQKERGAFFDERLELEDDLRISMFDIRRVELGETDEHAVVHVEYTWYLDSRGTVRKTTTEQHWRRHGKTWLMTEERWSRGEPMPGIPDPAPGVDDEPEPVEPDEPEAEQPRPARSEQ